MDNIEGFFLVPPLFKLSGLRIDTPARNYADTYSRDVAFFKKNSNRRLLLRTAGFHEFDKCAQSASECLQLPQLHVLVMQLPGGNHLVAPVYRGKAFFGEVDTDSETATILAEMFARGGIDSVATLQCDALFSARQQDKRLGSKPLKAEAIH